MQFQALFLVFLYPILVHSRPPQLNRPERFSIRDSTQRLSVGEKVGGKDGRPVSEAEEWIYCKRDAFLHAAHIVWADTEVDDGRGRESQQSQIANLEFVCTDNTSISSSTSSEAERGRLTEPTVSVLGCEDDEPVVGFQLEQTTLELTGLSLFCLGNAYAHDQGHQQLSVKWDGGSGGEPLLCATGTAVCGVQLERVSGSGLLTGLSMRCCPRSDLVTHADANDPRVLPGKVLSIFPGHHFNGPRFDAPYWYGWRFCPPNTFTSGIQLAHKSRTLRLLCSPLHNLRALKTVDDFHDDAGDRAESEVYSKKLMCSGGFVIGYQTELNTVQGVTNAKVYCSGGQSHHGPGFDVHDPSSSSFVSRPQFCPANQAVCGMKLIHSDFSEPTLTLKNVKLKCCRLPDVAELCEPSDELELVVECDASLSYTDTTCIYRKRVGMSITRGHSATEREELDVRRDLSYATSVSEGASTLHSLETSSTKGNKVSGGATGSTTFQSGHSTSLSANVLTGAGSTQSGSDSLTSSHSDTFGQSESASATDARSRSTTSQLTHAAMFSDSTSFHRGTLNSVSKGRTQDSSTSSSHSFSNSHTDMSSASRGGSRAWNQENTHSSSNTNRGSSSSSSSRSSSTGSSFSHEHGWSIGQEIGGQVGGVIQGVAVNVFGSLSGALRGTFGSKSEKHREQYSRETSESGWEETGSSGREQLRGGSNGWGHRESNSATTTSGLGSSSGTSSGTSEDKTRSTDTQDGNERSAQTSNRNSTTHGGSEDTSLSRLNSASSTNSAGSGSQLTTGSSSSARQQVDAGSFASLSESLNRIQERSSGWSHQVELRSALSRSFESGETSTREESGTRQHGLTSGYDWSRSTSETFSVEHEVSVELHVPAGLVARLYQVVGHCSYYSVRANVFVVRDTGIPLLTSLEASDRMLEELLQREATLLQNVTVV